MLVSSQGGSLLFCVELDSNPSNPELTGLGLQVMPGKALFFLENPIPEISAVNFSSGQNGSTGLGLVIGFRFGVASLQVMFGILELLNPISAMFATLVSSGHIGSSGLGSSIGLGLVLGFMLVSISISEQ